MRAKPLLRWAGSKKRQFQSFRRFFPQSYKNYAEPFAGSAAFLFGIGARASKLNDLNSDVIDFYRSAIRSPEELYRQFASIRRDAESYAVARKRFNELPPSEERTILFYYLNRNCFNGIYRLNKSGNFNVPFSNSRVSPYLTYDEFCISANVLSNSCIYNSDFEVFCDLIVEKNDFVFIDPPYYADGIRIFNEYTTNGFGSADFGRLEGVLDRLDSRGVSFLLTFPNSSESAPLAQKWQSKELIVRRTIAGNPNLRRSGTELLIANYDL